MSKQLTEQIKNAILPIYELSEAESIARIVLEDGFGIGRRRGSEDAALDEDQEKKLAEIIKRLLAHEPVQYVLGKTMFFGLPFKVGPDVLIPRQETEELVGWIMETMDAERPVPGYRILDIGTGSGCIPVVLKRKRIFAEVLASDVSAGAIAIARQNAALNNVEVKFRQFDILDESLWNDLPELDMIISNPPYITESEKDLMPENVLRFEPHLALFCTGDDPLLFYRKITTFAQANLEEGGWLFFETNEFNAGKAQEILAEAGFENVELRDDLNGKPRMLRGQFPGREEDLLTD